LPEPGFVVEAVTIAGPWIPAGAGVMTPRRRPSSRLFILGKLTARQHADVVGVDQIGDGPAGEVVFGHAAVGEGLPLFGLARGARPEDRKAADLLVAARVVDLVE